MLTKYSATPHGISAIEYFVEGRKVRRATSLLGLILPREGEIACFLARQDSFADEIHQKVHNIATGDSIFPGKGLSAVIYGYEQGPLLDPEHQGPSDGFGFALVCTLKTQPSKLFVLLSAAHDLLDSDKPDPFELNDISLNLRELVSCDEFRE